MEKKKKWMIFGGTAVVVVGVFLCIAAFFLYKGVTLFFDREIVADQYLEQMTSAASQGDRECHAFSVYARSGTGRTYGKANTGKCGYMGQKSVRFF